MRGVGWELIQLQKKKGKKGGVRGAGWELIQLQKKKGKKGGSGTEKTVTYSKPTLHQV